MNTNVIRAGSYYTTINSDCVEFCPHPGRQSLLFTGHYELLSNETGKIGQLALAEVTFADSIQPPIAIPADEYCIATNQNQEAYATRSVDMDALLGHPQPTFGQATAEQLTSPQPSSEDFPSQPFTLTNTSLQVHHQLNAPAILDAKWSYQPIPIYSSTNTTSSQPTQTSSASLIAGAFEDGTVRIYTFNGDRNQLDPQSAVQISTSAICLYIDWSNKQRYSPVKASYPELFPIDGQFQGEDDMAVFFEKHSNYAKFWDYYDKQIFAQSRTQGDCGKYPELEITPHYCAGEKEKASGKTATPAVDGNVSNVGDYGGGDDDGDAGCDDEFYEYDVDPMYFYQAGKRFVDNFVTCSLSDGSVAVCDVKPVYPEDNAEGVKFSVNLTHHWQAHKAECWVSVCDGFNTNLIYTGADDNLMKMWDLRLINTVNARMDDLELHQFVDSTTAETQKGFIYKNLQKITCPHCSTPGLSYLQPQCSKSHGVGFDMSQCTAIHGLGNHCTASSCYCNATTTPTSSSPTTQQYRFNIAKLTQDGKFNADFTPVEDCFPQIVNSQHQAGVIEIKPHPYNPFLLLTGSYDNHISLYDKRNLRKPVTRVDTNGGVWRIKWHPNPIYSNQFFIVNMYNGVSMGSINGMDIDISQPPPSLFGMPSSSDGSAAEEWSDVQQSVFGDTKLFQSITTKGNKSNYPSWSTKVPFQSHQHAILSPHLDTAISPTDDFKPANTQMGYMMDHCYNFGNSIEDTQNLTISLQQQRYDQHGSKTIVYGGDWCYQNNISDVAKKATSNDDLLATEPLNNLAVTCSFYNKRTDLLSFE